MLTEDLKELGKEYEEIVYDILMNGVHEKRMQKENNRMVAEILEIIKTHNNGYTSEC